mmetsp:Transcript_6741/g.14656  ORF Transcript_6741/g.14656 Transcript_6741/m.14656 type:complete len:82 (+) Transcript_6741:462-707(+)
MLFIDGDKAEIASDMFKILFVQLSIKTPDSCIVNDYPLKLIDASESGHFRFAGRALYLSEQKATGPHFPAAHLRPFQNLPA